MYDIFKYFLIKLCFIQPVFRDQEHPSIALDATCHSFSEIVHVPRSCAAAPSKCQHFLIIFHLYFQQMPLVAGFGQQAIIDPCSCTKYILFSLTDGSTDRYSHCMRSALSSQVGDCLYLLLVRSVLKHRNLHSAYTCTQVLQTSMGN